MSPRLGAIRSYSAATQKRIMHNVILRYTVSKICVITVTVINTVTIENVAIAMHCNLKAAQCRASRSGLEAHIRTCLQFNTSATSFGFGNPDVLYGTDLGDQLALPAFSAIFHCVCAENAISELLVKILT